MRTSRRAFLRALGGAAIALPFYDMLLGHRPAHAAPGVAKRLIIFYFPDGVPGPSQSGDTSLWHATGNDANYNLPSMLRALEPFKNDCMLFNGVSMGPTDSGSHPGGAKKLLTGVDGGNGESIDQYLARTVGASMPHRAIHLGVQSGAGGAGSDKFISYVSAGSSVAPEDSPVRAFERLFGNGQLGDGSTGGSTGGGSTGSGRATIARASVIDGVLDDMNDLRARLGDAEKPKLDLHLEALRELERRVQAMPVEPPQPGDPPPAQPAASCSAPTLNGAGFVASQLYDPEQFPIHSRMQIDLMVQAMACNLSRVGVIQHSYHTSELIMSRFKDTELHDPGYDMRSHQASHYGARHDYNHREFAEYVDQREWFIGQLAYLLDRLKQTPEDGGNMLDHTLVFACTEVCDGNTHSHDNMPFLLAGQGSGSVRHGRLLQFGYERHSKLLVAIARAMGADLWQFGQASDGPLYGVLPG